MTDRRYALSKYSDLKLVDCSCHQARVDLISLKDTHVFTRRIELKIDKAIKDLESITNLLEGLEKIQYEIIMRPLYQQISGERYCMRHEPIH